MEPFINNVDVIAHIHKLRLHFFVIAIFKYVRIKYVCVPVELFDYAYGICNMLNINLKAGFWLIMVSLNFRLK